MSALGAREGCNGSLEVIAPGLQGLPTILLGGRERFFNFQLWMSVKGLGEN
jgi:hypothetical protein